MLKITFMGAGSTVFAKNVLGDSMMTPSLAESVIALYDIDAERLRESELMLSAISHAGKLHSREILSEGNELLDPCTSEGTASCKIVDSLQNVGLALGILAPEHVHAG